MSTTIAVGSSPNGLVAAVTLAQPVSRVLDVDAVNWHGLVRVAPYLARVPP